MSGRVLVAGAINTDLVATVDRAPEAGETITGRSFAIHSGGKGANQAVAVARSGASAVMLGGVGRDDFGSARKTDLAADLIDTSWIAVIDSAASGVALITVELSGENRIAYIPGATVKVAPDHCAATINAVQPSLILSTNELSPECHRVLFEWAREHDVRVIFNAAPYSDEVAGLLPLIDVLIVNEGEASALQGVAAKGMSPEELGAGLRSVGATDVVITLGADGSYVLSGAEPSRVPGHRVDVVDTTGAGDTFCGALAAQMLEGATLPQAARYANAAGALATTCSGAQPSIPSREEIEKLMG
jgi:ribokinase